jgi:hypothetical protein
MDDYYLLGSKLVIRTAQLKIITMSCKIMLVYTKSTKSIFCNNNMIMSEGGGGGGGCYVQQLHAVEACFILIDNTVAIGYHGDYDWQQ